MVAVRHLRDSAVLRAPGADQLGRVRTAPQDGQDQVRRSQAELRQLI